MTLTLEVEFRGRVSEVEVSVASCQCFQLRHSKTRVSATKNLSEHLHPLMTSYLDAPTALA